MGIKRFLIFFVQLIIGRKKVPRLIPYKPLGTLKAVHFSAFSYGNAGDTLLPVVLRDLFNSFLGVKEWVSRDVHDKVSTKEVECCNNKDFIVVGGGGLFLSDSHPNKVSGWQWNCDIEMLERINKPIVAFAIGYNRFRGQDDFPAIFTKHLNVFVKKSVFIGIRNHGSIEKLKHYLNPELFYKLSFQPCMTTLISKIYPGIFDFEKKEDFIALNCAFDREEYRSVSPVIMKAIARVVKQLSSFAKIKVYSHMPSDSRITVFLKENGVDFELVPLHKVNQIIKAYSTPKLVIGMRGHSQMIPFGCHTPILSIVSHDKMQWFLDDIGHPDWGVDINDDSFENSLLVKAKDAYENYLQRIDQIKASQDLLWEITSNNTCNILKLVHNE